MNTPNFRFLIRNLSLRAFRFKKSWAAFLLLGFFSFILLRLRTVVPPPSSLSCNLSQPQSLFNDGPVLILYWGFPWGIPSYAPPECQTEVTKEGYCVVTRDKRRIKDAYAVLFHYTAITEFDIPWRHYRGSEQVFIWWSAETPSIIKLGGKDLRLYDNFFNWTWTYRRDSDVINNYGQRSNTINNLAKGIKVIDQIIAKKEKFAVVLSSFIVPVGNLWCDIRKFVNCSNQRLLHGTTESGTDVCFHAHEIWIVSKCDYTIGARLRVNYANELRKAGLDFDGYGKCFNQELPRDNYTNIRNKIKKYKFYFAFENGLHCKDYITEKFWDKSLAADAVPVVWGPSKNDILSVAPLDSFIFAEDYESPQKLADYLKFLDSNDQEYRKYFRWREDESMTDEKMIKMVRERYPKLDVAEKPKTLCEKLIENKKKNGNKIIKSLYSEFVDNPPECSVGVKPQSTFIVEWLVWFYKIFTCC